MKEEHEDDEISIDLSKVKNFFKKIKDSIQDDEVPDSKKSKKSSETKVSEMKKEVIEEIEQAEEHLEKADKEVNEIVKEEKKIISDLEEKKEAIEEVKKAVEKEEEANEELSVDFSRITGFFRKKKKEFANEKTDSEEDISLDLSRIKNIFKKKDKNVAKDDDEISIDWGSAAAFFKKNRLFFLLIIPIMLSIFLRVQPAYLPVTDDWAASSADSFLRSQVSSQISQQYPNLPDQNKNAMINAELSKVYKEQRSQISQQIKQSSDYFKSRMKDNNGDTYLLAIDPYFWMRFTKNVIETGHPGDEIRDGKEWDNHMYAPKGRALPADRFHIYFQAYAYKIMHVFMPNLSIMGFVFYIPVLLAALCVIPAFYITRRVGGDVGGFFAAMLIGVHASFLSRTAGGFSDTDAYNVLFPLLAAWAFLEAFETRNLKKKLMLTSLTGFIIGMYSIAWGGGWWYIFDFLLLTSGIYIAYHVITNFKEIKKGFANILKQPAIKDTLILVGSFIVATGIFTSFFSSFTNFTNAFLILPKSFITLKAVAITTVWPNVFTTVAEQNASSLPAVIRSIGGRFLFVLSGIGILLTLFKKDVHNKVDIKYAILLILWISATVYASVKGIRYIILLVPAFSIGFGLFVGIVYEYLNKWLTKELQINKIISKVTIILVMLILLMNPIKAGFRTAHSELPSMNDAWYESLDKINREAEPDAIINSWWDFGHWFKAIGDRAVTFDGTSQNSPMAHWIGKSLLTADEKTAVGILRMLDCGSNDAFDILEGSGVDAMDAIDLLNEIIILDEKEAREELESRGFQEEIVDGVLENTHCDAPENYYITSEDMIKKSGVWAHFGSWDFKKATMYNTVRSMNYDEGIKFLKEKFGLSENDADARYYEISSLNDANSWIAPWPSYASGIVGCSVKENMIKCSNGISVNKTTWEAEIPTQQGLMHPVSFSYVDDEGNFKIKEYDNNKIPYSAAIIPDGKSYKSLLMSPELVGSMFTRLHFFDGHGLEHFKLFSYKKAFTGSNIYVWKVDWEGGEENVMDEFKPKTVVSQGDTVSVNYIGWKENGDVFDASIMEWEFLKLDNETELNDSFVYLPISFTVGSGKLIPGFEQGVVGMKLGEQKVVQVPPEEGYGTNPALHELANKTLNFRIRVEKIE